jgi:tetratricopeptide (TPR) repeat protein
MGPTDPDGLTGAAPKSDLFSIRLVGARFNLAAIPPEGVRQQGIGTSMKKRVWLAGALVAGMTVGMAAMPVHATGVEDGEAGLAALNKGDFDTAIRLLTRAILIGRLSPDDSEFAYLNRGKAFASKGDVEHAIADYQKALAIKPDDGDAQAALQAVNDHRAGVPAARPIAGVPGDPWGLMSAMAGKFYWYQALGKPPHDAYLKVGWVSEQRDLSLSVRSRSGQPLVSEYKMDSRTGKIVYSALAFDAPQYGTVDAGPTSFTETTFFNGAPIRYITKAQRDGTLLQAKQVFLDGRWQDTTTVQLVETTTDELAEAGLMKVKKKKK